MLLLKNNVRLVVVNNIKSGSDVIDFSNKIYESKFIYHADKDLMTKCGCGVSFSPKTV